MNNLPSLLIASDSLSTRHHLKTLLESYYIIVEAASQTEVMEILSHQKIEFLIIDDILDKASSLDLCLKIREQKRFIYLPILLIIDEHGGHSPEDAIQSGITNFLPRPHSSWSVLTALLVATKFTHTIHELTTFSQKLKGLAEHDPLTHLYNRYFLFDQGNKEIAKALRGHFPLSLLMIDIDKFKNVNDTYGHLVGDEVLEQFAGFITKTQRSYDIAARFGGEEFVILLPNATAEQATLVAEKIRNNIDQKSFESTKGPIKITVSIGVAALTASRPNLEQLLQGADTALYQAKLLGRNQVYTQTP